MYQVLARKWRPQNFEEVVGQGQVTRTLANAITGDRLAHAYVFAGLRGTGKTSVARILAKCLNCEQGPTATPCSQCAPCVEIAESRAMDVLELDAASRTSVDNIRELQEVISYAPVRDRYKILIIDEAHMLSKQAFNALLKTLEEPPPNVVFVLATTEMQKVLPTILSRCQVFEFRRVGVRETADYLRRIGDTEEIRLSDAGWERIARAGEGSIRDSLSILERVLAFCGQEVEDDDLLRMLGGVRLEVLTGLFEGLARRDAATMLGVLDGLVDEGHDLLHFWSELIAALRDLMLMRAAPGQEELLARSTEEAEALREAAAELSAEDLTRVFQILADLEPGLKTSTQPRFLFEAALIRLAGLGAVRPIEELLRTLQPGSGEESPPPAPQKKNPVERGPTDRPAPSRPAPQAQGGFAEELIAAVKAGNPMLGVVIEEASAVSLIDGEVEVRFAEGQEIMARQFARRDSLDALQRHAEQVAGRKVRVRLIETPAGPEPATTASPAPEKRAAAPEARAPRRGGRRQRDALLDQARKDPGVKKLFHEFGAQVVDVRPLEAPQDRAEEETNVPEDAT
jgi:DNA polymerase-3 subunit gamma/tau